MYINIFNLKIKVWNPTKFQKSEFTDAEHVS